MIKTINSYIMRHLFVLYFLPMLCYSCYKHAVAKESMATPAVVGHKPTVTNVSLNKSDFFFGDTASLSYSYNDIDGDPEDRPKMVKWSYGLSTASGDSELLTMNIDRDIRCSKHYVGSVTVTPTSKSGDPLTGDPVAIALIVKAPTPINGFHIHPDSWDVNPNIGIFNLSDADKYCRSIGMKLPTTRQAQAFISHYNKLVQNGLGVPRILGWPATDGSARAYCRGKTEAYWTSDVGQPGLYSAISIRSGGIDNMTKADQKLHVMCTP